MKICQILFSFIKCTKVMQVGRHIIYLGGNGHRFLTRWGGGGTDTHFMLGIIASFTLSTSFDQHPPPIPSLPTLSKRPLGGMALEQVTGGIVASVSSLRPQSRRAQDASACPACRWHCGHLGLGNLNMYTNLHFIPTEYWIKRKFKGSLKIKSSSYY